AGAAGTLNVALHAGHLAILPATSSLSPNTLAHCGHLTRIMDGHPSLNNGTADNRRGISISCSVFTLADSVLRFQPEGGKKRTTLLETIHLQRQQGRRTQKTRFLQETGFLS